MPIESLEPRIALATGLTVLRLPLGALNIAGTTDTDTIALRSDEPGYLTIGTQNGDIVLDGEIRSSPVTIPMPKGAVTIDLLGGDDNLFLNPLVLPGSLTVNDPSGVSNIGITGLIVKGALTLNGSSGDDAISIDGRLSVGKDFKVEFNGGDTDLLYNDNRGLSFTVGGSFRVHGTAETTFVALGLSFSGQPVRDIDDDPMVDEELDIPLALREMRIGRDFSFEAAGPNNALLLGAAETRIGGRLIAKSTGAGARLDYFQLNDGPLRITSGVQVEAGGVTNVYMEALHVTVGGSFNVTGGIGNDALTVFGNNTMRLPKTTLSFGDGDSDSSISAREPWSLAGNLSVTAGMGNDELSLRGPGKVTGSVVGNFGGGGATITVNGDGVGRMSVGPLFKMDALSQVIVGIYNASMNGRVEVIGHGGNDLLAFDSAKVVGPVVFTGSAGNDAFFVDDTQEGYLSPSSFLGSVLADMGDNADTVVIGRDQLSGRATFASSFTARGITGETYMAAGTAFVTFKKKPVIA